MLTEKPPAGAAALDVKVSVETLAGESFSAARLAATETVGAGGTVKFSVALPVILRGFVPPVVSSTQQTSDGAANVADVVNGSVPKVPLSGVGKAFPKSSQFRRVKVFAPAQLANVPGSAADIGCAEPGGVDGANVPGVTCAAL